MFKRFTTGLAVGYVLGARAGQKRYEQMSELVGRALEIPAVDRLAQDARELVSLRGREWMDSLRGRLEGQLSGEDDDGDPDAADDGDDAEGDDSRDYRRGAEEAGYGDEDDEDGDEREQDSAAYTDEDWQDEDEADDEQEAVDDEGNEADGDDGKGERSSPRRSRIAEIASAVRQRGEVA